MQLLAFGCMFSVMYNANIHFVLLRKKDAPPEHAM